MSKKKILKIILIIFIALIVIACGILLYLNSLMDRINFTDFNEQDYIYDYTYEENIEEDIIYEDIEYIDEKDIVLKKPAEITKNVNIENILLLGVEAIGGGNGRSDCMIICTVDFNSNKLKLTSLMRDIYVDIPGYGKNKLNSAYARGGVPLIVQTIEESFGVKIDGTVMVNFDSFEKVIDALGGIDLEITKSEANYLNRNNYISNPSNRNLVEGINHLNGNQALGYSRVRYVSGNYGSNDFGRTGRQRAVINALFDKYKASSFTELISASESVLELIQTDVTKEDIIKYATFFVTSNINEIETLRIPLDNEYKGTMINKMSVLVPDWDVNLTKLHDFIYEDSSNLIIE